MTMLHLGRRTQSTLASSPRAGVALAGLAGIAIMVGCSAPGPGVRYKDKGDDGTDIPLPGDNVGQGGTSNTPVQDPSNPGGPGPVTTGDVVLDDFTDGNGALSAPGFAGRWRTYADNSAGTVTPAPDTDVVPTDGAIHVSGSGFDEWGVGLTVDLNSPSGQRQSVDLSRFRGVSIKARGSGSLAVEIVTPATTGAEEGGTCTADEGCYGHYAQEITLDAQYADEVVTFTSMNQPEWGFPANLDLTQALAINFLSRSNGGSASIDLWIDSVTLLAKSSSGGTTTNPGDGNGVVPVTDGTNPFAGRELHADGGSAYGAYNSAQGADRDLLAKVALNPAAFWLAGGDPGRAGSIVNNSGGNYTVLVAYNIPDRDCSGESAGGAGSAAEYRGWIDAMSSSLQGKEAAIILEPDALALSCGESTESLIAYAVNSLRQNPGVAVYVDGGHSNWVPAGEMANRLRAAGIEQATGFAINVSNFQPTDALINYGKSLSAQVGNKPFVIDTSRNGQGARGAEWCNPAGAGLGEEPTTNTGDPLVHALLWVKRPGESDGACGQCAGTPAGQFCTSYALELARNAAF